MMKTRKRVYTPSKGRIVRKHNPRKEALTEKSKRDVYKKLPDYRDERIKEANKSREGKRHARLTDRRGRAVSMDEQDS